MNRKYINGLFLVLLWIALFISGCRLPWAKSETTATLNVTEAYRTVEARLTQAVALTPSPTVTFTPTAVVTVTPTSTATPVTVTPAALQTTSAVPKGTTCDQAAAGNSIDVTIPDDTNMSPGQSFTKVWRLQNAGTCTWTTAYSAVLFSGEGMGSPASIPLPSEVAPGSSVDISVNMVAPAKEGSYQGNWKLQNDAGASFGIGPGGGSPFWVRIVVSGSTTITPSATGPTPSATATVNVKVSGSSTLNIGDKLDLDSNKKNTGGDDVEYVKNEQNHLLNPINGAKLVVFGSNRPSQLDCQNASLGGSAVNIEDYLGTITHLCYLTNQGLYGRMNLAEFTEIDETLRVQILTWAGP